MKSLIARLRKILGGEPGKAWDGLPRQSGWLLVIGILISLVIHLASGARLTGYDSGKRTPFDLGKKTPVKVRIVEVPKKKEEPKVKPPEPPPPDVMPNILETPQVKTEKPDEAAYVGNVDHKAVKEQRISDKVKREKAKDPGQKGNPDAKSEPTLTADPAKKSQEEKQKQPLVQKMDGVKTKEGTLSVGSTQTKPRNDYEALLPSNVTDLPGQLNAGYQDYVDDKIQEGDRIDINTTEYRYIGYFTNMRKAIELVWNYPLEASRKGMQGEVGLEFAINKDGRASGIKVIKSSGYVILDKAIVDAIKLASPFSPLPEGFGKNRIVVTGSFRYILHAYGSH